MSEQPHLRMTRFPRHYPGGLLGPDAAPIQIEVFISLMCPHSAAAYPTIHKLVDHYGGRLQARVNLWIQPWQAQDVLLTKAVVATGLISRGAGWRLLEWIHVNLAQFSDQALYHRSPADLYEKLATVVEKFGVERRQFLDAVHSDEVECRIKWMTHYGRQNGIHYSPSFMLQGFVIHEAESTWGVDKWRSLIDPIVQEIQQYEKTRGPEHLQEEQHYNKMYRPEQVGQAPGQGALQQKGWPFARQGTEERREPEQRGVLDKVKEMFGGDRERDKEKEREQRSGGGWGGGYGSQTGAQSQEQSQQQGQQQQQGIGGKIKEMFSTGGGSERDRDAGRERERDITAGRPGVVEKEREKIVTPQQNIQGEKEGQGQGLSERVRRIHVA